MTKSIIQGVGYAVGVLLLMLASAHYGWHLRTRFALKLAHFRVSEREWAKYDEELKHATSKVLPLRATVHGIHDERESGR